MKKRMKQTGALLMTLAMILSLTMTAFAAGPVIGTEYGDSDSTVTSEGGLPTDVTTVVLPTTSSGQFSMIFDSHGILHQTTGVKFEGTNYGGNVTDVDDSHFFFKVYTDTAVDEKSGAGTSADPYKPYVLLVDSTDTLVIPAGTEVVKYLKASTIAKIYATGSTKGKDFKWRKVDTATHKVEDVAAADFGSSGDYKGIAALEGLDPAIGKGLDTIAKLNKKNPNLYLKKTATDLGDATKVKAATDSSLSADDAAKLVGAVEYTFVSAYANGNTNGDICYVYFNNGAATKFYQDLGDLSTSAPPTAYSGADASGLADFVDDADTTQNVAKAVLTVGSGNSAVTLYRQRSNQPLLSFKATSAPVKVINKTNANLGVSMTATLTYLKGGDGKKDANNTQTYVYAKDYDATSGKFYDDVATAATRNVIQGGEDGVPVFYLTLSNGTDTEVMTYDETEDKATVSIGAAIPGSPDFFRMNWTKDLDHDGTEEGTEDEGYEYEIKPDALDKREKDYQSMTFNLFGAIDADNNDWNSFGTAPELSVTWKVVAIQPLDPPTVTPPASVSTRAAAIFQITNTTDKLVLIGVKQGGVDIAADKLTITTTEDDGTTAVTIAKGSASGTQDLEFIFQHPTETYRTKTVTVSFG